MKKLPTESIAKKCIEVAVRNGYDKSISTQGFETPYPTEWKFNPTLFIGFIMTDDEFVKALWPTTLLQLGELPKIVKPKMMIQIKDIKNCQVIDYQYHRQQLLQADNWDKYLLNSIE